MKSHKSERLKIALNLMYLASDIADGYATEVEDLLKHGGLYRNNDKQAIKQIKRLSGQLIKSVDKVLASDETSDNFAHDSDFLKEVIEMLVYVDGEEQEQKVIQRIKTITEQL